MNNYREYASRALQAESKLPEFVRNRVDAFYRQRVLEDWQGQHILRGRQPDGDAITLCSNDYLCLAGNRSILDAQADHLKRHGNGIIMSAVFLQDASPQAALERQLARWSGYEAAIVCQSGFVANTGLVQSIAGADTPVYVDRLAHMSLWEGVRAAGATVRPFHHNNTLSLERAIERYGAGIVVVDSVYSVSGSLAPLETLARVSQRRGCVLVVDESHSLGTHGPQGTGLVRELGLQDQVHFVTASLAKAFAQRAGLVLCPAAFSEYFRMTSLPAIFSSALLPHEVVGIAKTLEVIRSSDDRRKRLRLASMELKTGLLELGYNVEASNSQIIALECGSEADTIITRDALEARGIFGSVFCAPATSKHRAAIRFSLNSDLSEGALQRVLHICAAIRTDIGMEGWRSTRRRRSRLMGTEPASIHGSDP